MKRFDPPSRSFCPTHSIHPAPPIRLTHRPKGHPLMSPTPDRSLHPPTASPCPHLYRPFAARTEAAADRHRVASTATRLLRRDYEATTRATTTRLLRGYYEAASYQATTRLLPGHYQATTRSPARATRREAAPQQSYLSLSLILRVCPDKIR